MDAGHSRLLPIKDVPYLCHQRQDRGKGIFKQWSGGAFARQNLVYMDIYLCRFFYGFQKDLAKCTGSTPVPQLQHWNLIQVLAVCDHAEVISPLLEVDGGCIYTAALTPWLSREYTRN